ncbi:MAG: hypothetical protein GKS03_05570 [Alphaproteobacteria bacterium]|nr:hypothetical protein [Alphaproteobacteria bacterium]
MIKQFLPALAAAAILTTVVTGVAAEDAPPNRTLGFVVKDWMPAVYESKFIDECPAGLNISNDEIWWRGLTKEERSEKTLDGLITTLDRWFVAKNRGPNGEDVCINPEVIDDDPPLLTVEGATSFGVNLDGNVDGSATLKSCKHENFTSPAGVPGIDNQLYRLIGCIYGFRDQGVIEINANEMRRTSGLAMILIEITDVDDARNDEDVTVTFYRSVDQFPLDSSGQVLPFSSYRIDYKDDGPRYGDSIKGSIVDGVLQAGSGDVRLPYYGNYNYLHPVIRDMQIRLEITEDGTNAQGSVAGYYDLEQYLYHTGGLGPVITTGNFSCPAFFEAAKRMADGYPDPETGECTHISSAFEVNAFAAFIVHPDQTSEMETAER